MKSKINSAALALAVLAAALGYNETASAGGFGFKQKAPKVAAEKYTWRDGGQERAVWVDPDYLAEFAPSDEGRAAVEKTASGAEAVREDSGGVRLWKLGAPADAKTRGAVREAAPEGRFSPVFRDSPGAGRLRALPGGVVVEVDPSWDEQKVRDWAAARGTPVERKLPIGKSYYLLETEPGLRSLEIANELSASGEVRQAFPNWWEEGYAR